MKYTTTVSVNYVFEVEANSPEEAIDLAADKYCNSAEVGEIMDIFIEEEDN